MDAEEVLKAIESGRLDGDLFNIDNAVVERREKIRVTAKVDDYLIGDRVRVNTKASPAYIHGELGTIVGKARTKLLMRFDRPVGRFSSVDENGISHGVEVKVPLSIIDKV